MTCALCKIGKDEIIRTVENIIVDLLIRVSISNLHNYFIDETFSTIYLVEYLIIPAKNITWCIECLHCYSYINNTMGKIKELSVDLRQKIINFHKSGNSYSTISNRLAIPRSTVQSVVKKFKRVGTTENLPGRGRKPKLSPKNVRKRCHKVNINPSVVSKDIDKSLNTKGISVSTHIILRCLN